VNETEKYHDQFYQLIINDELEKTGEYEFSIVSNYAYFLYEKSKYDQIVTIIKAFGKYVTKLDKEASINYLVLLNILMFSYEQLSKLNLAGEIARNILERIDDVDFEYKSDLLGEKGIESIKSNSLYILGRVPTKSKSTKIGRNDIVQVRYRDGRIRTGKYKKLKEDIDSGACFILKMPVDNK